MKKCLTALAITVALSTAAHAGPTAPSYTLDVTWTHDGAPVASATSIIRDPFGQTQPFRISSGDSLGYGECSKLPDGVKLVSRQKWVDRLVQVDTKKVDGETFDLAVTAIDTAATGKTKTGPADCVSEQINTTGLEVHDVPVHMRAGSTAEVPLGDPQYKLVLKLVAG
ncbi:hypothetical protein [Paraburkholderia mimosarum]|uniref:hypothetical protein n=1 Tax=Paraburkholderia mimosarum TaxID=312026 RepID=UPI000423D963|nr:hypothetical protein [Paraburkholderia mimosarum]